MKKISLRFNIIILTFTIVMFSCVPAKEFKALQESYMKCSDENEVLKTQNNELKVKSTEFEADAILLKKEVDKLLADSIKKSIEILNLKNNYDKLDRQYSDLQVAHEELLKGNAAETRKLLSQLEKQQEDLQKREDQLRIARDNLTKEKRNLDSLNKQLNERNKRLMELEKMVNQKDSIMNALRIKVSEALMGFDKSELSVAFKEGKIYVSLEEQLLFKSGSFDIDQKGISAIKKLGKVLEQNPEINIMIEGHTDDVPYKGSGLLMDNWDLSVKRATSVVRILLQDSKINPKRLTAAGRSEYLPVDPLKTPEARKKNRRIEIILTPNLNELYQIISSQ